MREPYQRKPLLSLVAAEQPTFNRERLEDFRDRLRVMDRETLEFELTVITEAVADMRASLDAEDTGQTDHGLAWRNTTQRAYNRKNAEARLAFAEKHRRDRADLDAKQERAKANLERQERLKRDADERKQKRIQEADKRNDALLTAFIQEAKHQLPAEVYERIWTAANARSSADA